MKEQVRIMMDILEKWDCLKELTENEREYIEWQLNYSGTQAINEWRKKILEQEITLLHI